MFETKANPISGSLSPLIVPTTNPCQKKLPIEKCILTYTNYYPCFYSALTVTGVLSCFQIAILICCKWVLLHPPLKVLPLWFSIDPPSSRLNKSSIFTLSYCLCHHCHRHRQLGPPLLSQCHALSQIWYPMVYHISRNYLLLTLQILNNLLKDLFTNISWTIGVLKISFWL